MVSPSSNTTVPNAGRTTMKEVHCESSASTSTLHIEEPPPVSALAYAEQAVKPKETKASTTPLVSICKSLIAGGVAGGVSRTAVAPLERMKILLQVQGTQNVKYTGTIQGLRVIFAKEGLRGFFVGNGTNCARIIPNSAVKFYSYEQAADGILWMYRKQSGNPNAELTPVLRLYAGAIAGIIAMSATYPMDMVRGRLTVQSPDFPQKYKGMFHATSTIVREEGIWALYRGWIPSVIGVVPYVGLNFSVYETLKEWVYKSQPEGQQAELTVLTKLGCGALAGTTGQTVAYPLDVVRRRLQMVGWQQGSANGRAPAGLEYTGMVDCFSKMIKNEGVGSLYKGLFPNLVKVVPSIALAFVTYEVMRDLLGVEIRISD